ncbi:alkyl sulfatase [Vibrio astriarenae]|nr:alkyl sulfatase [Vibrio sp. C7]
MYGYLHDETLRLINHGVSITDIQDEFFVPKPLADQWYTRGYHAHITATQKRLLTST